MTLKKRFGSWFLCFLLLAISGCPSNGGGENPEKPDDAGSAKIRFHNASSFTVDIYKNLNPAQFDPAALLCTVKENSPPREVTVPPSVDQKIGDTFYPRYKVLLADRYKTGTVDIYVDAQRDLSNIALVVEAGETYDRTIPQPVKGQLKFTSAYVEVQNTGPSQIQIIRGDEVLYKLDDEGAWLNTGSNLGYYAIPFSAFDEALTVRLKFSGGSFVDFPPVSMVRGKIYSFTCNGVTAVQTGNSEGRYISDLQ